MYQNPKWSYTETHFHILDLKFETPENIKQGVKIQVKHR